MNALELALEKQRLRLAVANQRMALSRHVLGLTPLFDAAERVRAGTRWVTRHPEAVAAGVALLAAARPRARRFCWRWGKRAFVAWRMWRNSGLWLGKRQASGRPDHPGQVISH